LSKEQVKAIFAAVEGHRLGAFWILALATGLRRGELLGLRWEDVDFENRQLHVRAQLVRDRLTCEVVRRELKTRNAQRAIAIEEGVVQLLREHRRKQDRERELEARRWKESGYVFTAINGGPLDPDNILRSFLVLIQKAGLPRMTIHDLRHAHSSFMAMLNVHPRIAQAQLGHSNFTTTMEIYTHVADEAGRDVATKVDRFLFDTTPTTSAGDVLSELGIETEFRENVARMAAEEDISVGELVRRALTEYIGARLAAPTR